MKQHLTSKLANYQQYLKQNIPILESNGIVQNHLDFDFNKISQEYLTIYEAEQEQKEKQRQISFEQKMEKEKAELLKIQQILQAQKDMELEIQKKYQKEPEPVPEKPASDEQNQDQLDSNKENQESDKKSEQGESNKQESQQPTARSQKQQSEDAKSVKPEEITTNQEEPQPTEEEKEQEKLKNQVLQADQIKKQLLADSQKLEDQDIENFLIDFANNQCYAGELILSNHNLSDETSIRLANILKQNSPFVTNLNLDNNTKMSYLTGINIGEALKVNKTLRKISLNNINLKTQGANRIIEALPENKNIHNYNFGNLTDTSLQYLTDYLQKPHALKNIAFGEDISEPWKESTKLQFLCNLRDYHANVKVLSININCQNEEQQHRHNNFIAELSILMKKNRNHYILNKTNDYKSKELNTQHNEYYDGDNHAENAYKFSVKTYISNVIETLLDEGMYYLEKERANATRDENIFEITKQPINKNILEDLFTADGSILVLARYMIQKIQEKPELAGEY